MKPYVMEKKQYLKKCEASLPKKPAPKKEAPKKEVPKEKVDECKGLYQISCDGFYLLDEI